MKIVQVKGLVIPNAWTKYGDVSGVAIAANDESIIQIKPGNAMSEKLIKCLSRLVVVEGVWEDSGQKNKVLNVISLEVINDPKRLT